MNTTSSSAVPAETSIRRVRVEHRLWTDDLLLEPGGRLRHATHGTAASYYHVGDVLHVLWDDHPADIFVRWGDIFVHAGPTRNNIVNMRAFQVADLDPTHVPVAGVVLQVPGSNHFVELRPGSSDVDVFRAVFVDNEYGRPTLDFPVRTLFDLGANIGMASVFYALKYPDARIIALEPEAANYRLLVRNTKAFANIVPVHAAVWPVDTMLQLTTTDPTGHTLGDWGFQTTAATHDDGANTVALSIPTLMRSHGLTSIDLLKIDIEGAELELFEGDLDAWLPYTRCVVTETHERFRPGSDQIVTRKLADDFEELAASGENRIFVRPSESPKMRSKGKPTIHEYSVVTTARWETATIVEWLLYHRSIGFDHIYLYCNDDDPSALYEAVLPFMAPENPFVTFVHFGLQGQQRQMLLHFLKHHRHETRWIAFLDVDEFLCLPGLDNIGAFVANKPEDTDGIYFNWLFFGTSGFKTRPPGSVLLQYTRRQAGLHPLTKMMVQTSKITDSWLDTNPTHVFWHDLSVLPEPLTLYDAINGPSNLYFENFPEGAHRHLAGDRAEKIRLTACVYHYAIKSEQDFQRRSDRGLKGEFSNQVTWSDLVARGEMANFVDASNAVSDTYLAEYWTRYLAKSAGCSVIRSPEFQNLCAGKTALQSSISEWSNGVSPAADATNAINGRLTSRYQCHTAVEHCPWWQVDLASNYRIVEVRVFNRLDSAQHRLAHFDLSVSQDGVEWTLAHRKTDNTIVGGADGNPFIWQPTVPLITRFIRLTLLTTDFLHLDQVEVYGEPP